MEHQDWDLFTIKKKKSSSEKKEFVKSTERKIEESEANGNLSHKKMDISFGKALQRYRTSQNMTQKDIAQKLNIQIKDINEIESGKAKHNGLLMGKIKRIMNTKIK